MQQIQQQQTLCTAVTLAELPAGFVSFQQYQPSLPPFKNVNSAAFSLVPACHFGGNHATDAANVITTATF
jgi:hypothetical protein